MSETKVIFTWKGEDFTDYSKLIAFALTLKGKEQKTFVKDYCATGPYARQNIGYMSGYYNQETADKILEVFETAHPIFGTTHPTAKEALAIGTALGKASRKKA